MILSKFRLRDLDDNIRMDLDVIKQYEDALRVEDDPRRILKYRREIERQRESIMLNQKEYDEIKAQLIPDEKEAVLELLDQKAKKLDDLEILLGLLQDNGKIPLLIDTTTEKVVLILGRFTPKRKAVLNSISEELRKNKYAPVIFDFEKPGSRDITETISLLAHMARFIIADITDAKAVPAELERIVPGLPSVPVMPIILASSDEYALFEHIKRYPWVLNPYRYESEAELIASIRDEVIIPAEAKLEEIRNNPIRHDSYRKDTK